jgi:hypothetical protein
VSIICNVMSMILRLGGLNLVCGNEFTIVQHEGAKNCLKSDGLHSLTLSFPILVKWIRLCIRLIIKVGNVPKFAIILKCFNSDYLMY